MVQICHNFQEMNDRLKKHRALLIVSGPNRYFTGVKLFIIVSFALFKLIVAADYAAAAAVLSRWGQLIIIRCVQLILLLPTKSSWECGSFPSIALI